VGATAARAYFGFGMGLIVLHLAIGGSDAVYEAVGLAAAGAIALGIGAYRPANRRGWAALGVSQLLFATGDLWYDAFPSATFPAVPDLIYLGSYVFSIGGLLLLAGASFPWRDLAATVDTVLIAVTLALVGWMLFLDERYRFALAAGPLVAIAYPLADLLVLAILIRIALAPGRRVTSYWLLVASVLPLFVSDGTYVLPALANSYHPGSWLDAGWLGSYVLLGTAALHPSMRAVAASVPNAAPAPLAQRRMLAGGIAVLLVPVSLIVQDVVRGGVDILVVGIGGTTVLVCILARGLLTVRELDRLRVRAEESERKFRMVFERAPIGISVGRDGIMSETNPALQRMLGYTAAELARTHYTDVTHPDDRVLAAQAELDRGSRDSFVASKQYVGKDGRVVETRVHVVLDLDDGLGMSLIEDVSRQQELEERLRQAEKMEAIGKLAGGVAHDFNNLMMAVIGYSDLLLLRDDPATRDKLHAIRESAVRASDLTRQLLAFSRKQLLQLDEIDLRILVENMEDLCRQLLRDDIELDLDVADEPVLVHADEPQLQRAVLNLVVNAGEATPAGGSVTVAVRGEGGDAVLSVSDDGVGMDIATQARIFEPFFTTKPMTDGSGLGLSTAHGIVGQSGGTIEVESEPGCGSAFTIRLPAVSVRATLLD
jgi:PAS domain S-box-containing protein